MGNRLVYKAGGVSEALLLLQQSKAGLEGVVVEDLEVWEVLAMVCLYEVSQKQPMETRRKQVNQTTNKQQRLSKVQKWLMLCLGSSPQN